MTDLKAKAQKICFIVFDLSGRVAATLHFLSQQPQVEPWLYFKRNMVWLKDNMERDTRQ